MPAKEQIISLDELAMIKNAQRERFAHIDAGLLDHPFFLRPCRVKMLMLVDDGISYNQFYFGLSEVLDTLRMNPEWWVKFDVTRAHRHSDPNKPLAGSPAEALYAPHHENFRFDQPGFNIDEYDEVWFYGFNSGSGGAGQCGPTANPPPNALTDKELEILFRWMDEKRGGVFATGDHATLGEALCSRIPRVRSMRKWTAAQGVPSNVGPDRHDSLVKGHDLIGTAVVESDRYTFDDESDDIPMKTRLRWYAHHHCGHPHAHPHWLWPYKAWRSPHPVLCGKDGPIDILPDHPHEGEVIVPTVLNDSPAFCGYQAREYPDYAGQPLAPEIIAWARVQNDHTNTSDTNKQAANGKEFGAIGAYEGHCVSVGRVVTDSTWHHWFDVNLTGRMQLFTDNPGNVETGDPRKLNGFLDTPAGVQALDRIRNYYRNVAIWLAPPAKIKCMAARGLWGALDRFPLRADLHLDFKTPIWVIGKHAIDALGHYAGQCNVRLWWRPFLKPILIQRLFDPEQLKLPVESLLMLDAFAIGGILHTMLEARRDKYLPGKLPADKDLEEIAAAGVRAGLEALLAHAREMATAEAQLLKVVEAAIRDNKGSK